MTPEQRRVYQLGKVRALLNAAKDLTDEANRNVPERLRADTAEEFTAILEVHGEIRKATDALHAAALKSFHIMGTQ